MTLTTSTPPAVRSRRPYRLGIDAHTEFVAVLVSEMDAAVASLQAAAGTAKPTTDGVDLFATAIDRSVEDVRRLVRLLDIIDGPAEVRDLEPLNLPDAICGAAKGLDLDLDVCAARRGPTVSSATPKPSGWGPNSSWRPSPAMAGE
jgi:hypothetical protein